MRSATVVVGAFVAWAGFLFAMQAVEAAAHHMVHIGPVVALMGIPIAFAGWRTQKSYGAGGSGAGCIVGFFFPSRLAR
jgi:hypothetical protein